MYKLTLSGEIKRLADGAIIPPDTGNADYREYLAWREMGNEPQSAELPDAWLTVRARRNELLQATDWTQLPDTILTASQKTAWRKYRQALRDLTQDRADPAGLIWPEPPQ